MTARTALFAGSDTRLIQCAEAWLDRGHAIVAVLTVSPTVADRAARHGQRVGTFDIGASDRLADLRPDWLFSAANLQVLPEALILQARAGSATFHDGPLPARPGRNVPVWALPDGATEHAITWTPSSGRWMRGGSWSSGGSRSRLATPP